MGRAPCCDKANVKKGAWSPDEDAKLKSYIDQHGTGGNWITLPQKIGLRRCGKSCRLRWLNYLRPNIKHGGFTEEEDEAICSMYRAIGSRWSIIAAKLPGRTDNDIKNYWNTKLKKKLLDAKCNDNHYSTGDQLDTCSEPKKVITAKESNDVYDSSCISSKSEAKQQTSHFVHLHDMIAPWRVDAALLHLPPPAASEFLVQTQKELPLQPIEKPCNYLMELETTTSDSSYKMSSIIVDDGIGIGVDQNATALLNMSWCEVTSLIYPHQQYVCDMIDQSTCSLEVEENTVIS